MTLPGCLGPVRLTILWAATHLLLPAPSWAQVVIDQPTPAGGDLTIAWSGAGELFQLQRRTDLTQGQWIDLNGHLAVTTSATLTPETDSAFYRVLDLSTGTPTHFSGGSLNDLRALSSSLTFDHLVINGPLRLDLASSTVLQVNHLTLTSLGAIGYTRGECDHGSAPSLTIQATGRVCLGGPIQLSGAAGSRVTDSATCKSCYGDNAGNLQITAAEIRVTTTIVTRGGSGSTSVSDFGSSGCRGGDGGLVAFQADTLFIAQATIETEGGNGGTGYVQGDPNYGADGQPGELNLVAAELLQIQESTLLSDGIAHIETPNAAIASPVNGGDLQMNIGGAADDVDPLVEILHPTPDMRLAIDRSLAVVIRAYDAAAGMKEIHVTGLGHDQVHPANEMIDNRLTVVIDKPEPPAILTVIVTDNAGNQSSQTVSGLQLVGDLTIPSGTTYFLSDHLDLGETANLIIEGTLELPKSGEVNIQAGSLTLAAEGQIVAREPEEDLELARHPTLTITLNSDANLHGAVDLTGHDSLAGRDYDYAQDGSDFTLEARNISIPGSIILDGGYGRSYEFGWPARYIRQGGGSGGILRLTATDSITVTGSLSVQGGDSGAGPLGPCFAGGDAGTMLLTYGNQANLTDAVALTVTGGQSLCGSTTGANGILSTMKSVPPPVPASDYVPQAEVEPNGDPATAAQLNSPVELLPDLFFAFVPIQVAGSLTAPDPGGLEITYGETPYPISDLYTFSAPIDVVLNLELAWPSDADLELAIFRTDNYEFIESGTTEANPETLTNVRLSPGDYFIGVWVYDRGSVPEPAYHLRVVPIGFP